MSYRQSSFDPNAYEQPGRPLKPYNWVQWTGVALGVMGIGLFLVHLAGRLGWIAPVIEPGIAGLVPLLLGSALINSRREPGTDVTEEQRAKNKRTLIITAAICAAILGGALVIEYLGA